MTNPIRSELEIKLLNWAASQVPPVPVSLENVAFNKPSISNVFVEAFFMPTMTTNPTVDGLRKRDIGIFQVNCFAPIGKGMGQVESLAASIVNLYPVIPKTGNVSVEQTPNSAKPYEDTNWIVIPVTVKFRYEY
jgi:hypothetical protein